ncbi:MAG: ankyrin repeat domain-containing protein [Nitrosopumilus sp.]
MKAKFVYEALGDVLKPKSEKEIMTSIEDLDPNEILDKSISNGFLLGVKKALERGANVHIKDDWSLRISSYRGYDNVVKLLLDNGANVHAMSDEALRMASRYGYYDVVEILLKHGANVHVNDDYALRYASSNGHYDVVELLKKYM